MNKPIHAPSPAATGKASDRAAKIGLFLGPLLLVTCLVIDPPAGMSADALHTVGLALLMATWWSTEALPIPVTSLLPILLVPALGIDSIGNATSQYGNPIIFLFLGGFMLGLAMERWNLHKRIALRTLLVVGSHPAHQVAGFMLATAFLSMWVSNTATTIMMLPIGLSVIGMLDRGGQGDPAERERFANALLLGIAYAASIGGIATLIGTPPNALLAAFLQDNYGVHIGFGQWMLIGLPVSILMLAFTWWWLTRRGFSLSGQGTHALLREELAALGPLSKSEKLVSLVFSLTALAWIFQPALASHVPGLNDTSIAIASAVALFMIPVDAKKRVFLMDWQSAVKLPWGVLLLFGGGLSLAAVIRTTGLAEWIAQGLGAFGTLPVLLLLGLVVLVIIFLTEVTSNTATAAAFLPLLGAVASAQGFAVELLVVPAAIAASCAFMLPVATPPNAIVFGTGHMRISAMVNAGFALNIAGLVIVTGLSYLLVGLVLR
ncbi:anion transporter [Stutzerimonas nosocomialis]|uniref:Anion transporter n=1 Tax=Stutzerimonas nosocomialis TaxID=1056496 RepID=A0A5R9QEQ1_9GAMM|nr:DASS family sodium-coupled anion symporter [Stutzerimonas nosocomialis]TLX63617.1 anion transporter [Stutzerimonas nosocomialis]